MSDLPNDTDIEQTQSNSNDANGHLPNEDTPQEVPDTKNEEIELNEGESGLDIAPEITPSSDNSSVPEKNEDEDRVLTISSSESESAEGQTIQESVEPYSEDTKPEENKILENDVLEETAEPNIAENAPPALLHDRYNIFPSNPLPEFDTPSAKAFEARDNKGAYSNLFALICIPGIALRVDIIEQIIRQRIPGLLSLMDYGIIEWPILGKKTPAIIYESPLGGRVSSVMEEETSTYNNVEHMQVSVDGIIEALEQLSNRGITHRSLRHDNLYFTDENRGRVVIGDFVSTPAGFDQPVVYETIEKGMADEGSRGNGILEDDMYAFGVTIASMVQNQLPTEELSKEEIIISKIETSSFQTVIGQDVITSKALGAIRGLLIENPADRWGLEELNNWRNGVPNKPRPSPIIHEAHRPIEVGGVNHIYPRTLAYSMAQRPDSSINLIMDGTIENWIAKDYMDEVLTPSFAGALEEAKSQSEKVKDADAVLLAHVLIILDPIAPIRYKSISYMPDAFGTALATENIRGRDFRDLAESVLNQVPNIWNEINEDRPSSIQIDRINYARLRSHLQKAGYGYGVERCLYELNWDVPCQSPLFENEYVLNIEDVLPSLDKIEKNIDPNLNPVDRHIMAFVAARVRKSTEKFLQDIGDPDEAIQILGALKLLAFLQKEYGPDIITGLSKWIGGQTGPVIKFYQSRSTQKILEVEVPRIVRNGNLNELLELLDNPEARTSDESGYEDAIEAFRIAQDEIKNIEHDMGPNSDVALLASRKVASVTSVVIMSFVIVIMFFSS